MIDSMDVDKRSRWLRDLLRFVPLKSQFVLSGNVRDRQKIGVGAPTFLPLNSCISSELKTLGYLNVLSYDCVNGFKIIDPSPNQQEEADLMAQLGISVSNGHAPSRLDLFENVLEKFITWSGSPIALIVDFASRLIVHPNQLSEREHSFYTRALIRSHEAKPRPHGEPAKPFLNTVLWIVDKRADMPDWMTVENPCIRHIPIPTPDHSMRRAFASSLIETLEGASEALPQLKKIALQSFVDNTEGLLLVDLMLIAKLCREEKLEYTKIGEAVRRYKVGVSEDPWQKIDRDKIRNGQKFIMESVKGQAHAVGHMLDIVKRAITGVGAPRRGGRPRGVAFLAGPTGVGKTELAKSMTRLLFGDESAYIRFDMSEFSAEHSDQRLMGAPPGYIGYDMGGELTNAIREKPFSVVLFDEIEKAHPRILDKFLQILDEGVLTSGRGERVYFTEALIIFTSNLGIYQTDKNGARKATVSAKDRFEDIQKRVREEIEAHFKLTLNRPEILNRIGDNIIVFDFIRDDIAKEIFKNMVDTVLQDLTKLQNIHVTMSAVSRETLQNLCLSDLSHGGRGIRNKIETYLVNPLSRSLFDKDIQSGCSLSVDQIVFDTLTTLELTENTPIAD